MTNQFLEDANNGEISFYANESEVLLSSAESGVNSTRQLCSKPSMKPSNCYSSTSAEMTLSTPMATSTSAEVTLSTPTATSESTESRDLGLTVGLVVGLPCLLLNVIQLAVITGMCCLRV